MSPLHDIAVTAFVITVIVLIIMWVRSWKTQPSQWIARYWTWRNK